MSSSNGKLQTELNSDSYRIAGIKGRSIKPFSAA
jgi:hypothetical protein